MKDRIVTYETPDGRSLRPTGVRHAGDCHHLRPNRAKPHTADRRATPEEMRTFSECRVC